MQKYISPEGEEFVVEEQATNRILNEGIPFIIIDIKEPRLAIKEDDLFLYTNMTGNIPADNTSGLGFYASDTRFLSCWELYLNGREPILLSTSAQRDYMAHIELTNADIVEGEQLLVAQETINIRRLRVLGKNLLERVRIKNYNPVPVTINLDFAFFADFADIFEVRGLRRTKRGQLFQPKVNGTGLTLAYLGLDNIFRQTKISFSEQPDKVDFILNKAFVRYHLTIAPFGRKVLSFNIVPLIGEEKKVFTNINTEITLLNRSYEKWTKSCTLINTDNELFNSVLNRGRDDIRALLTKSHYGGIITAGIPWYVSPFGRDGLISALQTLLLNTELTRNSLEMLAHLQGQEVDPWRDEEPGKIMHELRRGELASLNEIPHTPYYGSVDATPLFLLVLTEYYKWTGAKEFFLRHKEAIFKALDWIDNYGDLDGDGLVEYQRRSRRGLINQGWKDSYNSVVHTNGEFAHSPIALIEVQAYVYYAKKRLAQIFKELGEKEKATQLKKEAEKLKKLVNEKFWIPEENYFAMALDGDKRQVKTVTSNPGQLLWSGILTPDKAEKVVNRLMQPDMFSGWGIRTVSKKAVNYNPMSYHNGSVWPHDNGIIIRGLKRYGYIKEAIKVATGLFDAAIQHTYFRLPELFCGFTRRGANAPVSYPVACSPQAWSAGVMFMVVQSILGLTPDAPNNILYVNNPTLPVWLNSITLSNLKIGDSVITIKFTRSDGVTSFTVPHKEGKLRVVMEE